MAGFTSRVALGVAIAAALTTRQRRARAGINRLADHQLRSDRQPLQPARSDHRAATCARCSRRGAFISSRPATPAACAKTKPFRSSSATRCISRRPTAPIHALDATTGAEKWKFQLPNNDRPSKRGLAYWPGGGGVPPSIIFGALSGGAVLDQGVGRHAQCRASARTASSISRRLK